MVRREVILKTRPYNSSIEGQVINKEEYFDKIYRNWGEDFWRFQI